MRQIALFITALLLAVAPVVAATPRADRDKVAVDSVTYGILVGRIAPPQDATSYWQKQLAISRKALVETDISNVYRVNGDNYQVETLRNDFYVVRNNRGYSPLNDARYPLETLTNLLLGRIHCSNRQVDLTYHPYGRETSSLFLSLRELLEKLTPGMESYCMVPEVKSDKIRAVLVLHNVKDNFIHLMEVTVETSKVADPDAELTISLYPNIPQNNVRSLFADDKVTPNAGGKAGTKAVHIMR